MWPFLTVAGRTQKKVHPFSIFVVLNDSATRSLSCFFSVNQMANLPILNFEEKIIETVEQNPVVVVIGETGSGKSTQLSQMLHRRGYTKSGIVAVTQPRRVAAVSVAR